LKAFEHKKCLFCGSKQVKKNGTRDGKQRYKCTACNKRFSGGGRLDSDTLWQLYSDGKQTAAQLAEQHGCSLKTIRRYLAKAVTKAPGVTPQAAVIANHLIFSYDIYVNLSAFAQYLGKICMKD